MKKSNKKSDAPSPTLDLATATKKRISAASFGVTFLLAAIFSMLALAGKTQAQVTYAFTNLFTIATGTGNLATGSVNRGMAYDAVSNLVYVANTGTSISAFDGTAGTLVGSFIMTGVSGGTTFSLDQIGVAGDGAIYGVNLCTTNTSNNKLYRWSSWNATASVAFNANALANGGSLTGGRIGDTFAVTGSGVNTLILCGVGAQHYFVLFSTTDGLNFTPTVINVASGISPAIAANVFGLCFYTNNTFLVKPYSSGSSTVYDIQYPANFASQTLVTGTVLASTTTLGGSYNSTTLLSYEPSTSFVGALQTGTTGTTPEGLFGAPDITTSGLNLLASTNFTAAANVNATGAVAAGGSTTTNFYALDTGNALYGYKIITIPPVKPSISTAPVGGSYYLSDTLSVTPAGTTPFSYIWQASSNDTATASTFTNVPGATTNSLTITSGANYYQVIITNIAGAITSTPVQVTILQPVTNAAVSTLWRIAAGQSGYSFLSTSDGYERGIAYDTNSQQVVVSTTSAIYILDGNTAATNGTMNLAGLTFGGLLPGLSIDQVGIADDGAVYAGNLVNGGASFIVNRWNGPTNSATGTQAYFGNPGGNSTDRWGDTMAVRGAGAGTQIAIASQDSANIAILNTSDGMSYTSEFISIAGAASGFAQGGGLAFGAGNTLWGKTSGGDLWEVSYSTNALTGSVVFDYKEPAQIASAIIGVGIDPVNNIMAGINDGDSPHDLQLFELTGTSDSPVLFNQSFFASANSNPNGSACITVKYPRVYGLDANNGIVALTYGVPATTGPSIITPPASATVYVGVAPVTFTVSASGSLPLYYQWRFNSNDIPGANSSSFTITNTVLTNAGYYDVVVHNIANAVTSTPPALLTFVVPVTSPNVTPLWNIAPGTNTSANGPYLTTSGYETRGLAYDPTSNPSNLLVADHYYVHDYNATTGAYLGDLNTLGFPTGGVNGWTIDQIGVADDGTLYSANLSLDGTGFSIITFGQNPYTALNYSYGGATGGSDLNTLDPTPDRWGDTMALRGSGTNTQILFGSYNGTNVALFTTPDGVNFSPTLIAVQDDVPLGFAGAGIAFGAGNTFYAKGGDNYNLREVAFDPVAGIGTVIETYTAGVQVPNDLTGLGVDVTNTILGGVCYNDSPHDAQLYLLSGNTNAPYLFDQDFFPSNNSDVQENSVVTLKGGYGFALDVNNGIVAFTYSEPAAPGVEITAVANAPGNVTLTWADNFAGHGYQVQYKTNLSEPAWINLGARVTNSAPTGTFNDAAAGTTRFYQVLSY